MKLPENHWLLRFAYPVDRPERITLCDLVSATVPKAVATLILGGALLAVFVVFPVWGIIEGDWPLVIIPAISLALCGISLLVNLLLDSTIGKLILAYIN